MDQLQELFETINEDEREINFAFASRGCMTTAIPCCQDSLAEAILCVYRRLEDFYSDDDNDLFEFIYYYGDIVYLDHTYINFGEYGDYTKQEIADYIQDCVEEGEEGVLSLFPTATVITEE